ncbi:MAG TPA: hypothetical protein VFG69_02110 [Nannocystaceae bacterium]|nr:hypothetical protein [Nannocystaceae bacterium]
MAELSEIGRKLIDTAMAKDEPPPVDESWGTLVSRLTSEAPRDAMPPRDRVVEASAARRRWIPIALAVAVIAAIALALAWWMARDRAAPPPVTADAAPPATEPAAPATRAARPAKAAASANAELDEAALAQLLVDAEAALAAGDPDRAMALLQEHAERAAIHPQAAHRMALRVSTLCAQGKTDEARAEGKAFLSAHRQSQWSDTVRRSCAVPR